MEGQHQHSVCGLDAPVLFILSITIRMSLFLPAKKFTRALGLNSVCDDPALLALLFAASPRLPRKSTHGFAQPPRSAPAIVVVPPRTHSFPAGMGDTRDHSGTKRRSSDDIEDSRKKTKMGGVRLGGGDDGAAEEYNPYLAHMYDGDADGADGTVSAGSAFAGMRRRHTTAKQAETVEDSDANPFTQRPHTTQYFRILEARRDLPVHKQR